MSRYPYDLPPPPWWIAWTATGIALIVLGLFAWAIYGTKPPKRQSYDLTPDMTFEQVRQVIEQAEPGQMLTFAPGVFGEDWAQVTFVGPEPIETLELSESLYYRSKPDFQ